MQIGWLGLSNYGWAILIITFAFIVRGVVGFGAGMISISLLLLLLPIKIVVPIVLCLELLGSLTLGAIDIKQIYWKELHSIWPFTLVGLGLGLYFLSNIQSQYLMIILGCLLLAYVVTVPLCKLHNVPPIHKPWGILFGFIGGVMGGMYGTGGPSLAAYLQRRHLPPRNLRATIQFIALIDNVVRSVGYIALGLLSMRVFTTALWLAPPTLIGIGIGNRLHHRLSSRYFEWAISTVLAVIGVKLVAGL